MRSAGPSSGSATSRHITECASVLADWFDRHGVHHALVRPDHYVFGTARDAAGAAALVGEASRRMGIKAAAG